MTRHAHSKQRSRNCPRTPAPDPAEFLSEFSGYWGVVHFLIFRGIGLPTPNGIVPHGGPLPGRRNNPNVRGKRPLKKK